MRTKTVSPAKPTPGVPDEEKAWAVERERLCASKAPKVEECGYCGKSIVRVRTPEGLPRFAWKAESGFYCPTAENSGCWHSPKSKPEENAS